MERLLERFGDHDEDQVALWASLVGKLRPARADQADEAIEAARRTNDMAQRIALFKQFQDIFAEEVPALLLYHPVYSFGVHDKVRGVTISKLNRPGDRFRTASDWYIATERISAGAIRQLDNSTP